MFTPVHGQAKNRFMLRASTMKPPTKFKKAALLFAIAQSVLGFAGGRQELLDEGRLERTWPFSEKPDSGGPLCSNAVAPDADIPLIRSYNTRS